MPAERAYYHVVFTVTRGKPVFLNEEIDAAFKALVRQIAGEMDWNLIELETMPNPRPFAVGESALAGPAPYHA
jgi:REP element-mobilizing transposase RayT